MRISDWSSDVCSSDLIADLPWMLFFIAVLKLLHWTLGLTVLVGGLALLALTLAADRMTRAPISLMTRQANLRIPVAETTRRHAVALKALDLGPHFTPPRSARRETSGGGQRGEVRSEH